MGIFNTKIGVSALNKNSNLGNTSDLESIEHLKNQMLPARVIDIVLDESHPDFTDLGGWVSIGSIRFEDVNSSSNTKNLPIAKPLFPQLHNPPLINELVLIFNLPDKDMGDNDTSKNYYYLNTISIWNNPHHNAYPNVYRYSYENRNKTNNQLVEKGITTESPKNPPSLDLNGPHDTGGTFIEKSNVQPVMPYSGDNIIESRWGSSIRLGSTIKSPSIFQNKWSESGNIGDPILVIKNGQTSQENIGYLPTSEDINTDPSSIYVTSTQNIPISASSLNYTAISNGQTPTYPSSYSKDSQIILNSSRLLFNSTKDSILMSSQKVINLASIGDIGLASRKSITLEADDINLGGVNATQPAIAGETFLTNLKSLTLAIQGFAKALALDPKVLPTTAQLASRLEQKATDFNKNYDNYTSKKVKLG
jgi:hypothetical protein